MSIKLLQPLSQLQIVTAEILVTITETETLTTTADMTGKRGATHGPAMEAGEDLGTTGNNQSVTNTHTGNDKDGAETHSNFISEYSDVFSKKHAGVETTCLQSNGPLPDTV